jgi:hypothetical protein
MVASVIMSDMSSLKEWKSQSFTLISFTKWLKQMNNYQNDYTSLYYLNDPMIHFTVCKGLLLPMETTLSGMILWYVYKKLKMREINSGQYSIDVSKRPGLIPFVNGNINSSCLQRVCCQWHHSGPRGQWLMSINILGKVPWSLSAL